MTLPEAVPNEEGQGVQATVSDWPADRVGGRVFGNSDRRGILSSSISKPPRHADVGPGTRRFYQNLDPGICGARLYTRHSADGFHAASLVVHGRRLRFHLLRLAGGSIPGMKWQRHPLHRHSLSLWKLGPAFPESDHDLATSLTRAWDTASHLDKLCVGPRANLPVTA